MIDCYPYQHLLIYHAYNSIIYPLLFAFCQGTITCRAQLKENIYFNRQLSFFCDVFSITGCFQLSACRSNNMKLYFTKINVRYISV